MKTIISISCLLVLALVSVEARPKRSVLYTVPVVSTHSVVHDNPISVVKTEQVNGGGHSSYSYSTEVKSNPHVHTHQTVSHRTVAAATPVVAAAPVVATAAVAPVATVHHTVPAATYATYGYHPSYYPSYYPNYYHYSPYSYVVGK